MPKKSIRDLFSRKSTQNQRSQRDGRVKKAGKKHSRNLHEIDNKSNMKPKRLPVIHVGFALFTILVSYK